MKYKLDVGKFYTYSDRYVFFVEEFVQDELREYYQTITIEMSDGYSFSHRFNKWFGQSDFKLINNDKILKDTQKYIDILRKDLGME